jgi:hypothetical protein
MFRLALSFRKKPGLAAAPPTTTNVIGKLTSQRAALHQGYGDAPSPLSPVNPTDDATVNDGAKVSRSPNNKDTSSKGDEGSRKKKKNKNNPSNNNTTTTSSPSSTNQASMQASVEAYSEGTTTLVQHPSNTYRFIIDEPEQLGGRGLGPNPITMLLGSLLGCSQYTASTLAKEQRMAPLECVSWSAQTEYDLQGVVSNSGGGDGNGDKSDSTASTTTQNQSAKLQSVRVRGTVDTNSSQQDLDALTTMMIGRNIIAATLQAAGAHLDIKLQKGQVDHECQPACELHHFMNQNKEGGGDGEEGVFVTGVGGPNVDRQGDSPQQSSSSKKASVSVDAPSHATISSNKRGMHTSPTTATDTPTTTTTTTTTTDDNNNQQHHLDPSLSVEKYHGKNGEDISREHLHAELEPQIQKETSEKGSPLTRGGAYASRDHPAAQGPFWGEENGEVVEKETAGTTIHPPVKKTDEGDGTSSGTSDESDYEEEEGSPSPLGDRPDGDE